jgi:hypothetical protein
VLAVRALGGAAAAASDTPRDIWAPAPLTRGGAGLVAARLQQWGNVEQIGLIQSLRVEFLRRLTAKSKKAWKANMIRNSKFSHDEDCDSTQDSTALIEQDYITLFICNKLQEKRLRRRS